MIIKDEVLRLKKAGLRNAQIADMLKVSRQYTSYVVRTSHNNSPANRFGLGDVLTVRNVSALLGIHKSTVRRWSDQGRIASFRVGIGRMDRKFRNSDLMKFIANCNEREDDH